MVEVRFKPNHTHNYRKVTRIAVDSDDEFTSPTWANIVDDEETHASEVVALEAVGIEVATSPTSTPK